MANDIEMIKGDNETFEVSVYDEDDVEVILVGNEPCYFTMKLKITDASFVVQKKSTAAGGGDAQIKLYNGTNVLEIYLLPADTASLDAARYVYDVQLTYDSEVKTIIINRILLKEEVT